MFVEINIYIYIYKLSQEKYIIVYSLSNLSYFASSFLKINLQ